MAIILAYTEVAYVPGIRRFIFFHDTRPVAKIGKIEIREFLIHLAVKQKTRPASMQNQAFSVALF